MIYDFGSRDPIYAVLRILGEKVETLEDSLRTADSNQQATQTWLSQAQRELADAKQKIELLEADLERVRNDLYEARRPQPVAPELDAVLVAAEALADKPSGRRMTALRKAVAALRELHAPGGLHHLDVGSSVSSTTNRR